MKHTKKQTSKQKHRSAGKNSGADHSPSKSSLRKSNSEGNIPLSVTDSEVSIGNIPLKKSVTFSQHVLSEGDGDDLDCGETDDSPHTCEESIGDNMDEEAAPKRMLKTCSWSHPGVVIQNGLEMEEKDLQTKKCLESSATNQASKEGHPHRKTQSARAKVLAKIKEIPREEEPCPCRAVTRPTAALLAEAKNGNTGTRVTSSRNGKLLV